MLAIFDPNIVYLAPPVALSSVPPPVSPTPVGTELRVRTFPSRLERVLTQVNGPPLDPAELSPSCDGLAGAALPLGAGTEET